MKACKSCGFPVPAVSSCGGSGFRVFCPSCGAKTTVFHLESEAKAAWEKMNGEPEPKKEEEPKKEKAKGKKG